MLVRHSPSSRLSPRGIRKRLYSFSFLVLAAIKSLVKNKLLLSDKPPPPTALKLWTTRSGPFCVSPSCSGKINSEEWAVVALAGEIKKDMLSTAIRGEGWGEGPCEEVGEGEGEGGGEGEDTDCKATIFLSLRLRLFDETRASSKDSVEVFIRSLSRASCWSCSKSEKMSSLPKNVEKKYYYRKKRQIRKNSSQ